MCHAMVGGEKITSPPFSQLNVQPPLPLLHLFFSLCLSFFSSPTLTRTRGRESSRDWVWERENVREREHERERTGLSGREERKKSGLWKTPSSWYQQLRSTIIRGPTELKFCREVHNTWISIVNSGDLIWSNLQYLQRAIFWLDWRREVLIYSLT